MATVRFVEKEHVEILRDYLGSDPAGAVILVYPEAQAKMVEQGVEDGDDHSYDFGGESDLMVDVVSSENHYIFQSDVEE